MFGAKFYKEKIDTHAIEFDAYAELVTQKFINRFNIEVGKQSIHAKVRVVNFSVKIDQDKQNNIYAYCEIYYDITN